MLETVAEKKVPPPLPPKARRGFSKDGGGNGGGGGATILSNGHVVKIRIDPVMGDADGGGGGGHGGGGEDGGACRDEPSGRRVAVGRRSGTVKINITCVDPTYVFGRGHYSDEDDEDNGHRSPLDSGTGSDLDTGSRRDESDDGTCSCDSLTSSGSAETPATAAAAAASTKPVIVAAVAAADRKLLSDTRSAVGVRPPRPPPPAAVDVQQRCYGDAAAVASAAPRVIDTDNTDQYYSFHMNENVFDEATFRGASLDDASCGDTIRSAKGTVRGVKNRVRAGIAAFLQPKTDKTWQEKEAGKVVLYTTTMGIVRDTYQRCLQVRQILRTHLVKYVERDVFMSREVQKEIRERLGGANTISVPQLFVEGNLIGDAEAVERLNESGELRSILKPFKSPDACTTCQVCGGYRLLPCPMCNGSKKSVHRNHFTTEMIALKCMNCDEVGLVQCYAC